MDRTEIGQENDYDFQSNLRALSPGNLPIGVKVEHNFFEFSQTLKHILL